MNLRTRQTMARKASTSSAIAKVNITGHKIKKNEKPKKFEKPKKPMSPVEAEAHEIRSSLKKDSRTFVKSMAKSIVGGGFWLGLPAHFCRTMLPKVTTEFTLVDEDGEEWISKYLAHKHGFSAGWRRFSTKHKLKEEDVLIFHLVMDKKFKVYIVRAADVAPELVQAKGGGSDTFSSDAGGNKGTKRNTKTCAKARTVASACKGTKRSTMHKSA